MNGWPLFGVALSLAFARAAFAAVQFVNLSSTPPGGTTFDMTYGISADGSVVVGTTGVATPYAGNEAAIWTASSGRVGLGQLTLSAYGVSGDGHVVVGQSGPLLGNMAYRWTQSTGVVGLGYLPGHGNSSAFAASVDGSVVVGESDPYGGGTRLAFRWTQTTGMASIGFGTAHDVSDDGTVIVGSGDTGAFRWTTETSQVQIGPGYATACSSNGSVVAGYGHFEPQGTQAWIWSQGDGIVPLGDLAGGGFRSEAHAISGDGRIVVGSGQGLQGEEAIIWDADHGVRSIKAMLLDDYGLNLVDYHLTRAHGISADGSVIVGFGSDFTNDGHQFAWMVTVPEPSALFGFVLLLMSRRTKRDP